jgi:hypothetical protein
VFNWLSATAFAYVAAVQLIDFLRILIYKIWIATTRWWCISSRRRKPVPSPMKMDTSSLWSLFYNYKWIRTPPPIRDIDAHAQLKGISQSTRGSWKVTPLHEVELFIYVLNLFVL